MLNGERVRFEVAGDDVRSVAAFSLAKGIAFVTFVGTYAERPHRPSDGVPVLISEVGLAEIEGARSAREIIERHAEQWRAAAQRGHRGVVRPGPDLGQEV